MDGFHKILALVDASAEMHPALHEAAEIAMHNGAALFVVDAVPEFVWHVRLALPEHEHIRLLIAKEKEEQLNGLAEPIRKHGVEVTTKVLLGKRSVEIIREVIKGNFDLMVSAIELHPDRKLHGVDKVNMQLLRHCPCAVWLLHQERPPKCRRLLAAVDPSPDDDAHAQLNAKIMSTSLSIAESEDAELLVAHCWGVFAREVFRSHSTPQEFSQLEEATQSKVELRFIQFLSTYGLNVREPNIHLIEGDRDSSIPRLATDQDVDLVVMGTVADVEVAGISMGSTAERILRGIDCAILALKPPGFISPVRL